MRSYVSRIMRRMKGNDDAAIGLLAAMVVALIIIAIVAAVVFVPWQTVTLDKNKNVARIAGVEKMIVGITSVTGDVEVSFGDLPDNLVQLSVKGLGHLNLLTSKVPVLINLTSSQSVDGKTLNIQGDVKVETQGSGFSFSDLTIKMVLDRSIPSQVNVLTDTGRVSLTAGSGTVLNGANLQTTAGAITIMLGEGANLTGNVSAITTVGAVTLNWHNVQVKEMTHVTLGAATGAVEANIFQQNDMKGNVTYSTVSTTGSISLAMDISNGNAARVDSASGFDNVNVQKNVGFTGSSNELSSSNYLDAQAHRFDIVLSVNTGSINLNLQYAVV